MSDQEAAKLITVLGATGYIGNRLVTRLLDANYQVRAASRSLAKLNRFSWSSHPRIELVKFDALDRYSLKNALAGSSHAFYLIHSMNRQDRDFVKIDRALAQNIVEIGQQMPLKQLIYLGGLADDSKDCSEHLRSRIEVGELFQKASFPTTILRAAMVIGSGSVSFEMLRYATDRCPVMLAPYYLDTISQPIAVSNLVNYLENCIDNEDMIGKTFDVGGPNIVTYRDLIEIYAEQAGLPKRKIFYVNADSPLLGALCLSCVTPISEPFIHSLICSLKTSMICNDASIKKISPQELLTVEEAIKIASDPAQNEPLYWNETDIKRPEEWSNKNDPAWAGGKMFVDTKKIVIRGKASDVWKALSSIGNETDWYGTQWLWEVRAFLDSVIAGGYYKRGRTNENALVVGDQIDWWHIHAVRNNELLVLKAKMNLPGVAFLEYSLKPLRGNRCQISQTVRFIPKGLTGEAYWYAIKPLHDFVFASMLHGLALATKRPVAYWTPWTVIEDLFGSLENENEKFISG